MTRGSGCSPTEALAGHLQPGQLQRWLARFATFGAQPQGGLTRLTGSRDDGLARRALVALLRRSGGQVRIDAVGNIFGIFPLADAQAPLVMSGSHLDSQSGAGPLDGSYGVLAALCAARALLAARKAGQRFAANLCVVSWCNEEGARFRPSTLGSACYAGRYTTEFALACRDDAGVTLGSALQAIGFRGSDAPPPWPQAYLELHIEQGPRLEQAGVQIGIVSGNWGVAKWDATFIGEQAHTGPTAMAARRDALLAAAHAIVAVRALAQPAAGDAAAAPLHSSVGRLVVQPNASNVVAARAQLSIELRSPDGARLECAAQALQRGLDAAARSAGVRLEISAHSLRAARALPARGQAWIARAAQQAGASAMALETIAGHDALALLDICPVGLMFVPSIGGVSHHPAEATHAQDLETGLRVLALALYVLCQEPTA